MKILQHIRMSVEWIKLAVTQPRGQLTAMQQKARNAIEILAYCTRHLREDRAPVLSAALAFRTLFGLLPVLVVATVTARAILGGDFANSVGELLQDLGLGSVRVAGALTANQPADLATWLQSIVEDASKVNLAALGWVGFGVVTLSAIWLLVAIESSFNVIYRAPSGRSWPKRMIVYWFLLTGGPLLLIVLPWLNGHFTSMMALLPSWEWLATMIDAVAGTFIVWVFMLLAFLWVPNTRVQVRPAMIGALVAAILLETGKRLLGLYTTHALTLNQLYGSLGLIPLFMFWVYLMWMFVLFGLEVSAILQVLRGRRPAELSLGSNAVGVTEPAVVLRVMDLAAAAFDRGEPIEAEPLSHDAGVPIEIARSLLERLAAKGMLRRLEQAGQFAIARPLDSINAAEALAVGFALADETSRATPSPLLAALRKAQADALAGVTLGSASGYDAPNA
jgi:membrane protein